jgi:hypothetical protein
MPIFEQRAVTFMRDVAPRGRHKRLPLRAARAIEARAEEAEAALAVERARVAGVEEALEAARGEVLELAARVEEGASLRDEAKRVAAQVGALSAQLQRAKDRIALLEAMRPNHHPSPPPSLSPSSPPPFFQEEPLNGIPHAARARLALRRHSYPDGIAPPQIQTPPLSRRVKTPSTTSTPPSEDASTLAEGGERRGRADARRCERGGV